LNEKPRIRGAGRESAPAFRATKSRGRFPDPQVFRGRTLRDRNAPGRAAVFFASFLFGGLKRKEDGGRGAAPAVLIGHVTISQAQKPGGLAPRRRHTLLLAPKSMQKRACHWRGARLRLSPGSSKSAQRIVTACLSAPVLNGSSSQWFTSVSVRTGTTVPVLVKTTRSRGHNRSGAAPAVLISGGNPNAWEPGNFRPSCVFTYAPCPTATTTFPRAFPVSL
jgi:hypothetical protein